MDEVRPTMPDGRPARPSERVDAACDRFEAAWRAGPAPRIEDAVAAAEAVDRPALLRELVALERELRRRRRDRPAIEEYLGRFPADAGAIRAAFGAPAEAGDRPAGPPRDAGRDLLLGVLALQNNFIGRDELMAAFAVWVADKARPLGSILMERGALDGARRALLEALVGEHLKQHGGDLATSLAAVSSLGSVREDLGKLAPPDLQASLATAGSRTTEAASRADETADYAGTSTGGGRFRILRPHAKGGLGQISVALDEELHREVALKQLQPKHAADPASRSRFVQEAEVTGALEHPGIVPVYGLGHYDDGRPFYAMRFVRGDSLKDAIARFHEADEGRKRDSGGRMVALQKLLRRFLDVCDAIEYAHSRGVLHRDLKPGNIMVGKYGETLVVDWGLAKVVGRAATADGAGETTLRPASSSGPAETLPGSTIGTPAYMSPEQAAGDLDRIGRTSDVYSLGATLYALLTGKPPIEGPDVGDVLRRVQAGQFLPPRQLNPRVPPALDAICRRAMVLRPEDRYPSPRSLADDVERWLADEPVTAHRERWTTRAWRWARRHPMWSIWIAGVGLIDVCILLPFLIFLLTAEELFSIQDCINIYIFRSIVFTLFSPVLIALACQAGALIGLLGGAALGVVKRTIKATAVRGAALGVKGSAILAAAGVVANVCLTAGLWTTVRSRPAAQRLTPDEERICLSIAERYNGLARLLATSPFPRYRNPQEAVRLASTAFEMYPADNSSLGTLGVAHYRARNWDGAIAALEGTFKRYEDAGALVHLLPRGGRGHIVEGIFLAMSYHRKGNVSKAREWYDRCVREMEKLKSLSPGLGDYRFVDLSDLRAEAKDLIGSIN